MGWRDSLQKASFRGVSFFVDASYACFGRRNVLHEYPLRDLPYSEDLGRKARQFTIEAYVLGDDYLSKRDALIAACEKPGQGELTHPYYGQKSVCVSECRVEERDSEGGLARFSITFVEAGERLFPSVKNDIASRVVGAKDNLLSKAKEAFESVYQISALPQFVLSTVKKTVQAFSDTLLGIKGSIAGPFADFYYSAREIANNVDSLIFDSQKLSSPILNVIAKISRISEDPKEIVAAYKILMNFSGRDFGGKDISNQPASNQLEIPVIPASVLALGGTYTRKQEQRNVEAIVNFIKQSAIAWMAPAAARAEYASLQDTIVARDEILSAIDQQMEIPEIDDDIYQALHDLRKTLSEALPSPNENLPSLVPYQNIQTKSSLLIAYDLYEKLNREEDLLQRNQVEHPGFVPGGILLEVICEP